MSDSRSCVLREHTKRTCIVRDLRRMSYGDALRGAGADSPTDL